MFISPLMSQNALPRALGFKYVLNISILTATFRLIGSTYLCNLCGKRTKYPNFLKIDVNGNFNFSDTGRQ